MPLREIEERFTRSELVILAWRSQEQHYNLQKDMPKKSKKGKRKMVYGPDDIGPQGMPDEFFNEDGEIDLRKVKGEDARRYFEMKLGIPMPPGVTKFRDESDVSNEIRKAYNIRP
jgi:hypothetical protein